jgi:colanic acid biosynthesis glycosyl transferase WcaI
MAMTKPSVLFINRTYPPGKGATGRVLRDLAHAFAKDGWTVTVLTTGEKAGVNIDGTIRVKRIKATMSKTPFNYFMIWTRLLMAALRLPGHTLVVTMTDPPMLVSAGRFIARKKNSSHIHWCQDLYPDILPVLGMKLPGFMMNWLRDVSRRAMKSCDRVIVVGRCMARHLSHTGLDMSRVTIIPNWPDREITNPIPITIAIKNVANDREAARYENGQHVHFDTAPKFRVLYAGNLGRAHPVSTILEAAGILQTQHPEVEFVFVGDGPVHERLAMERAKRGLDNIRLLPTQPAERLRELMESGDVHLISMKSEAAGMIVPSKLYSALAAERPCILIGPEQSEPARVINDYHAGSVVAQGNASALASTIHNYLVDGNTWFSAQEGAARANQDFKPDQSMTTWIKRARESVKNHAR